MPLPPLQAAFINIAAQCDTISGQMYGVAADGFKNSATDTGVQAQRTRCVYAMRENSVA